jgi:hypothetical protein
LPWSPEALPGQEQKSLIACYTSYQSTFDQIEDNMKFAKKDQFFQAYATALDIDFDTNKIYAEMLEKTKIHLEAELAKIKSGSSIEHATQVTLIPRQSTAATTEALLCAHLVAEDLRNEGYEVLVGFTTSGIATVELWIGIRLI